MTYEDSVAEQAEEQIFRLKHGWGYGKRTRAENRRLAVEAADRARAMARRHPFAQETEEIPRRLITTMPPDPPEATLLRWDRARLLTPDWEHVLLVCDRRNLRTLDNADCPLMSYLWSDVRSGAQLADIVRVEELYLRGGVYIDADLVLLRHPDELAGDRQAWVPAEDLREVPDISNFAMGFPPRHPALAMLIDVMKDRLPGPTWWSGPGALRVAMRERADVHLLDPDMLCPVNWTDLDQLEEIHDLAPEVLMERFPESVGVHLYEGSWRSGKSRRTKVDD